MSEVTVDAAPASAPETPVEKAEHAHVCANCGTRLQGPFCHACGQKGHLHSRLWHMAGEFAEGIAHFDGRLWRTLPLLAFNPGRLSREWRQGRRVRYVAPLHIFLFATFLLFLIPNFTGRHLIEAPKVQAGAAPVVVGEDVTVQMNGNSLGPNEVPVWVNRLVDFFDAKSEKGEYYAYKIETLAYKLSFVLIPIQVFILSLLLLGKWRFTLYDHSVVALYGVGFLVLAYAVVTALPEAAAGLVGSILLLALGPIHAIVHLRGAYDLSWPGAVFRGAALGAMSVVGFGAFLLGVVALGLAG